MIPTYLYEDFTTVFLKLKNTKVTFINIFKQFSNFEHVYNIHLRRLYLRHLCLYWLEIRDGERAQLRFLIRTGTLQFEQPVSLMHFGMSRQAMRDDLKVPEMFRTILSLYSPIEFAGKTSFEVSNSTRRGANLYRVI